MFSAPTRAALMSLDEDSKRHLIEELRKSCRSLEGWHDARQRYESLVLEEIHRRAATAALRTIHW